MTDGAVAITIVSAEYFQIETCTTGDLVINTTGQDVLQHVGFHFLYSFSAFFFYFLILASRLIFTFSNASSDEIRVRVCDTSSSASQSDDKT